MKISDCKVLYSLVIVIIHLDGGKKKSMAPSLVEKGKDLKIHPTKGGKCITEYLTYDW